MSDPRVEALKALLAHENRGRSLNMTVAITKGIERLTKSLEVMPWEVVDENDGSVTYPSQETPGGVCPKCVALGELCDSCFAAEEATWD